MNTLVVNLDRLDVEQDTIGDSLLKGEYFTGIAFEEHAATGSVVAVVGFRDGKRHGAVRDWTSDGRLTEEEYLERGAPHGPRRTWHRNGQLAVCEYSEHFFLIQSKRWDENGMLVEEYSLRDAATLQKLAEAHKRRPRPIIDIDLKTLTFFERPEGWGRSDTDLPAPQAAPSLVLCRALEAQTLAGR